MFGESRGRIAAHPYIAQGRQDVARHPLLRGAFRGAEVARTVGRADADLDPGHEYPSENSIQENFREYLFHALGCIRVRDSAVQRLAV